MVFRLLILVIYYYFNSTKKNHISQVTETQPYLMHSYNPINANGQKQHKAPGHQSEWSCVNLQFPQDGTVSQLFPLALWNFDFSLLVSGVSAHRSGAPMGTQRYASTRNSLPCHVCALSVSLLSAQSATMFVFLLGLNWTNPFAQTWKDCLLYCFVVTLYSWTTPFCSSSGGGCQETTMAVPLSPLSVTVTLRGGALGAGRVRQRKTKTHVCARYIFAFPMWSLAVRI